MGGWYEDSNRFFEEAFSRNLGLLTKEEQSRLRDCRVGIVGCGGVGGFHLLNLVRLGVGKFTIADMDTYNVVNIQRQAGAYTDTIGRNKAEVMRKIAESINPYVQIKSFTNGVTPENVDSFFEGVDVFIDGIDFFAINERRMLFKKAYEKNMYAITAGPLGFGTALLIFAPGKMTFDEYFDMRDDMPYEEKLIAFGVGLAPASLHMRYISLGAIDLRAKKGPSLVSACVLSSSFAATEALAVLLNRRPPKSAPHYLQCDPYLRKLRQGYLRGGNRHPIQLLKRWYLKNRLLGKKSAS